MKIIRSIIEYFLYFLIIFLLATIGILLFNIETGFIKDITEYKILFKIIAYLILFSSPYFTYFIRNKEGQQIDDVKNMTVGLVGLIIVYRLDEQ